jgi:hypothetical protein
MPPIITKIPEKSLDNPVADLQAGDIVFFTMRPDATSSLMAASDSFVTLFQSFVEGDGGHKNIAHIGLMVNAFDEKTDTNQLKMAHLLLTEYKVVDPTNYISKRTTIVYRPKNAADRLVLGDELSLLCKEYDTEFKKGMHFRWWIIVGSFFRRFASALGFYNTSLEPKPIENKEQEHKISGSSICPKFIVDSYIEAARRLARKNFKQPFREHYMNIAPSTLLKSFQSYVHNNINYACYILPNKFNSYPQLLDVVRAQHERIAKSQNPKAQEKAKRLLVAIETHENEMVATKVTDPYRQSLHLMKLIMPILRENTGTGLVLPTSYKVVIARAKSQGIYPEYCEADTVEETEDSLNEHLEGLQYTSKQREIYLEYRRKGFTDAQAQYEAKPTFKQWCANHARPLKATSATVLGVFGLLAYGKIHTAQREQRNAAYTPPSPSNH